MAGGIVNFMLRCVKKASRTSETTLIRPRARSSNYPRHSRRLEGLEMSPGVVYRVYARTGNVLRCGLHLRVRDARRGGPACDGHQDCALGPGLIGSSPFAVRGSWFFGATNHGLQFQTVILGLIDIPIRGSCRKFCGVRDTQMRATLAANKSVCFTLLPMSAHMLSRNVRRGGRHCRCGSTRTPRRHAALYVCVRRRRCEAASQ